MQCGGKDTQHWKNVCLCELVMLKLMCIYVCGLLKYVLVLCTEMKMYYRKEYQSFYIIWQVQSSNFDLNKSNLKRENFV
jgi:hypothetical protein